MKNFKSNFYDITYDEDKNFMEIKRYPEDTDEEYKLSIISIGQIIKEHKPQYIFVDMSLYDYPINPQVQEWSTKYLSDLVIRLKTKKIAYLMPKDFVANLAFSDMLDNARKMGVYVKYFTSKDKAIEWLTE